MTITQDTEPRPQSDTTQCKRSKKKSRVEELATPRESKAIWYTSFSPSLVWGNQELIRPISRAAFRAVATPRLLELSNSKWDHRGTSSFIPEYQYGCGRSSTIWHISPGSKLAIPTERINDLARHKTVSADHIHNSPQFDYSCGRSSSIWKTSNTAMKCPTRPRTAHLAHPKLPHPQYQPPRQVYSVVSETVKNYSPTSEILRLAVPKSKLEGPFREPQWIISQATLQASASQRVNELAHAKRLDNDYEPCRDVIWKVTSGALNAVSTNRLCELAKPIIRDTMDNLQFNPDAFNVKPNAKHAKASARIEELAQPIQRGGL